MGNEVWSRISGALGQVPGRASNIAGLGLDTIATINALAGNPARAIQFLQYQAAAQQDPTLRSLAMQSPFQAGLLGLGVHNLPPAGSSTELARARVSPEQARGMGVEVLGPQEAPGASRLGPVLPPLLPAQRASQALSSAKEKLILADPERAARAELGMGEDFSTLVGRIPAFQALADTFPNVHIGQDARGGFSLGTMPHRTFSLDEANASARFLESQSTPERPIRALVAPDPRGGYQVRGAFAPQGQQQADPALLRALGLIPPEASQGQPQGAPTTPQVQPEAPVGTPQRVLPDDMPVGQLAPQGQVGYPPPAFLPGGQTAPSAPTPTAPTAAPSTGARRELPTLPPGTRESVSGKVGGLTLTRSRAGAPAPGKPLAAVQARQLAQLSSSAQAARLAIAALRQGPRSPLQVSGFSTGVTPPHLAGPFSGRALGVLATVSGQPLAVEEANLAAYVAHAFLGITSLTRLGGLTKDFIEAARPLLPDVRQPTEILTTHLERLAAFYESLSAQQEAFANLSPEQKQAAIQGLFTAIMSGGGQGPATLDLRR